MKGRFTFEWADAFSNSELKGATIAVLRALQTFLKNETGYGYPTQKQIAQKAKRTRECVNTHLKIAEKKGWIIVGKYAHKNGYPNNTYQAVIPNKPSEKNLLGFNQPSEKITKPSENINQNLVKNINTNSNINSNNTNYDYIKYAKKLSIHDFQRKKAEYELKKKKLI
jgi:hypothetical protein